MDTITPADLATLRERANAATPGPWHWAGNTDTGEPYLATWLPGVGRCQVLSIGYEDRSTTGRAADALRDYARESDLDPEQTVEEWARDGFGEPVKEPRLQLTTDLMCVNARELAIYEVAPAATSRDEPSVYRADIAGLRHPDAAFIAAANPATILALLEQLQRAEAAIEAARTVHDALAQQADEVGDGLYYDTFSTSAVRDHLEALTAALNGPTSPHA